MKFFALAAIATVSAVELHNQAHAKGLKAPHPVRLAQDKNAEKFSIGGWDVPGTAQESSKSDFSIGGWDVPGTAQESSKSDFSIGGWDVPGTAQVESKSKKALAQTKSKAHAKAKAKSHAKAKAHAKNKNKGHSKENFDWAGAANDAANQLQSLWG